MTQTVKAIFLQSQSKQNNAEKNKREFGNKLADPALTGIALIAGVVMDRVGNKMKRKGGKPRQQQDCRKKKEFIFP